MKRLRVAVVVVMVGLFPMPTHADPQVEYRLAKTAWAAGDFQDAARFARNAAEEGSPEGQLLLSVMYTHGKGVSKDVKQGVQWLRKAADHGLAEAEYALGSTHFYGKGVPKDEREALAWYRRAAEIGRAHV